MTIEEKAKAYDEALKRAKKEFDWPINKSIVERVFPELKESEDESMRKCLISYLKGEEDECEYNIPEMIAYLEKKKEQKLYDIKREWWNKDYLEGRKDAHIPAKKLGLPSSWDFQKKQRFRGIRDRIKSIPEIFNL